MSFVQFNNVGIKGVAACVPAALEDNMSSPYLALADAEALIKTTGIARRHLASAEVCTSDLCLAAAEKLIASLGWQKDEIEGLVFVTQTPDYILPATSPMLQQKLGLSANTFTLDISLGCSGYIYGLSTLAAYMQTGMIKKALLLVGDTISKICSPHDKSTYPLFGDAGTATALEYMPGEDGLKFHLASDGSGKEAIIIKDGGFRNQFTEHSLLAQQVDTGISRNAAQLVLDGMDVFSFGISKAPESVNLVLERFAIDKENVDLFFFHQANKMMNERIRKKLALPVEKVPYSLENFGNTSSATIPLTMVTTSADILKHGKHTILGCGFGVGLSWGSVILDTNNLVIPDLIYLD